MADVKTHLRELSVATTVGLMKEGIEFNLSDLYDSTTFMKYARKVISTNISSASNIEEQKVFSGELKQIVDNGFQLGKAIYENDYFHIPKDAIITWQGNDTQKEDPVDITIGEYGFSLKEESFILENMGLYKLLNCYTGSTYKKRHIFSDYARPEYEHWFSITWSKLIKLLQSDTSWEYNDSSKGKRGRILLDGTSVKLEYFLKGKLESSSVLPKNCTLSDFEHKTTSKTREQVFSKYINQSLDGDQEYNSAQKACAEAATSALAQELNDNLSYTAGLPRFLRFHNHEYYYAKTTSAGVKILRVPAASSFGDDIVIESIVGSVPQKQANILTTIANKKTGETLVLRNECRFSHGQFNGTPEAKMYYERGGSLDVIYEQV